MEQQDKIILIGAGNVAHHLGGALLKAGENLCQIYSRTLDTARQLGLRTGISYTAELNEIYPDGDIYIFCVVMMFYRLLLRRLGCRVMHCFYTLREVSRWMYSSHIPNITG